MRYIYFFHFIILTCIYVLLNSSNLSNNYIVESVKGKIANKLTYLVLPLFNSKIRKLESLENSSLKNNNNNTSVLNKKNNDIKTNDSMVNHNEDLKDNIGYKNKNLNNSNNNINKNNTFNSNTLSPSSIYSIPKKEFSENIQMKNYQYLISSISKYIYTGSWFKKGQPKGIIDIHFDKPNQGYLLNKKKIGFSIRIREGKYLLSWISLVFSPLHQLSTIYTSNNSFIAKFEASISHGYELNAKDSMKVCIVLLKIQMEEPEKGLGNKVEYKGIKGEIIGERCGINFTFTATKEQPNKNSKTISFYCLTTSLLLLLHLFNSLWLNHKLNDSIVNANSISLVTICENALWNSYGSLSHFYITIHYVNFFGFFSLVTILYFINFSFIDLKLLYKIWSLKYTHIITDPILLRKKLVQCYFKFYIAMMISTFFVIKCYFDYIYVILLMFFNWIPQFIFNYKYKNRVSMPIFYYLIVTLNRLFPSFYFRGFEENFLTLKPNKNFVIFEIIMSIILLLLLYSQTILGARWFLPGSKKKTKETIFYLNNSEFLNKKKDMIDSECIICLDKLIIDENTGEIWERELMDIQHQPDISSNFSNLETDILVPNSLYSSNILQSSKIQNDRNNTDSQITNNLKTSHLQLDSSSIPLNSSPLSTNSNSISLPISMPISIIDTNKQDIYLNSSQNTKRLSFFSLFPIKLPSITKLFSCDIKNLFSIKFSHQPFLDFHEVRKNMNDKPIILLYCGHAFHSWCLEEWLSSKKECPSCRRKIDDDEEEENDYVGEE